MRRNAGGVVFSSLLYVSIASFGFSNISLFDVPFSQLCYCHSGHCFKSFLDSGPRGRACLSRFRVYGVIISRFRVPVKGFSEKISLFRVPFSLCQIVHNLTHFRSDLGRGWASGGWRAARGRRVRGPITAEKKKDFFLKPS